MQKQIKPIREGRPKKSIALHYIIESQNLIPPPSASSGRTHSGRRSGRVEGGGAAKVGGEGGLTGQSWGMGKGVL